MSRKSSLVKFAQHSIAIAALAALAACGGDPLPPVKAAASNLTATISAADTAAAQAIVSAVKDETFAFAAVPALGTTEPTTVKISGTGTAPTFEIGSGGKTASGNLGFGSCIFTIVTSTYEAGHPLAVGQTVTVTPCAFTVQTSGIVANGASTNTSATMTLGQGTTSAPTEVTVSVSENGTVSINSTVYTAPITIQETTGSSS